MKRFIAVLIISALIILIIPFIDYSLTRGELFGLWTVTFGAFVGVTLFFIGLIFVLFSSLVLLIKKKEAAKNISLNGVSIMGIGALTTIATVIFWLIIGQPFMQ